MAVTDATSQRSALVGPPEAAPYLHSASASPRQPPASPTAANPFLAALTSPDAREDRPSPRDADGAQTFRLDADPWQVHPGQVHPGQVRMGRTLNGSATFKQSGSACLDFFFSVTPSSGAEEVRARLAAAWAEDPLLAVQLLLHLRAVRGCGKSDRKGFLAGAMWLQQQHPRTLAANLHLVPRAGCYKDLLEIVRRALGAEEQREAEEKDEHRQIHGNCRGWRRQQWKPRQRCAAGPGAKAEVEVASREERVERNRQAMQAESERAAMARRERRAQRAARVLRLLAEDEGFRALHKAVAEVFARDLLRDVARLQRWEQKRGAGATAEDAAAGTGDCAGNAAAVAAGSDGEEGAEGAAAAAEGKARWLGRKGPRLTLAAKWAPSLYGSYDRCTLLAEGIARRLFPQAEGEAEEGGAQAEGGMHVEGADAMEGIEEEEGLAPSRSRTGVAALKPWSEVRLPFPSSPEHMSAAQFAYAVRDRYQREVLAPLRAAQELPEHYMSSRRWAELPYGRVPSVCMKLNKERFRKHDGERFAEYLSDVAQGKAKIAAGAVLVHEVVRDVMAARVWGQEGEPEGGQVAELQWRRIVSDMREQGSLGNCIAVCDVSGSMEGQPMEVAIALSLLVSELSEAPWRDHVITFSERPQIHRVQGSTLAQRVAVTAAMDAGLNTNFQAVFDGILRRAKKHRVPPEAMVRRLFVFSDMEFDEANGGDTWATDYEEIERKYGAAGYPVPELVFWNLSQWGSGSTPVCARQKGAALVSGLSKNMLLAVMGGEELSPMLTLRMALRDPMYSKVVVVD